MDILHLGCHYDPDKGGGNLRNSSLHLLDSNGDIYIISLQGKFRHRYVDQRGSLLKVFIQAIKVILRHKPRIIYVHHWALSFVRIFSKNVVLEIHSLKEISGILKSLLFVVSCRLAKLIVVLSNTARQELLNRGIKTPIEVIPNGLERGHQYSVDFNKEKISVYYIGSLHSWQGVDLLAKTAVGYRKELESKFRFTFVGGGPRLSELMSKYNLPGYIDWKGHVDPSMIKNSWSSCDILFMARPSTMATETTVPLKFLNSLEYGRPSIISDLRVRPEMFNEEYPFVLKEYSEESLFILLNNVSQETLRVSLGFVKDTYEQWRTWDELRLQLKAILSDLA